VAAQEYWHMGARRMRLRRVVERMGKGVKSVGVGLGEFVAGGMEPGEVRCWGVK